jgi:RNA polymerase sigma factor (TIGR02999 family)
LIDVERVDGHHRSQFYAMCAQIMRHILVDAARKRATSKRGGPLHKVRLGDVAEVAAGRDRELIALDDALNALAKMDERRARVIELRFYGGLSVEETAEVLNVSGDTVMRDWRLARAWLLDQLEGGKVKPT